MKLVKFDGPNCHFQGVIHSNTDWTGKSVASHAKLNETWVCMSSVWMKLIYIFKWYFWTDLPSLSVSSRAVDWLALPRFLVEFWLECLMPVENVREKGAHCHLTKHQLKYCELWKMLSYDEATKSCLSKTEAAYKMHCFLIFQRPSVDNFNHSLVVTASDGNNSLFMMLSWTEFCFHCNWNHLNPWKAPHPKLPETSDLISPSGYCLEGGQHWYVCHSVGLQNSATIPSQIGRL